MSYILAVRTPIGNRLLFFRSGPYVVTAGGHVLVQVEGDLQLGKVERVSPEPESATDPARPEGEMPVIFRTATEDDLGRDKENQILARKAFELCRQCIQEHKLNMKLVDVVVLFDGSKILFFFTAPNRIDFRELVKDLVKFFRTRIELRQIGARHETQMVGGIGNCGQLICCQRFLRQFAPVTVKMAKEQNLFLNPAKISGVCNRLLCCLSYEQNNYEEFLAQCPKVGKKFATALGPAKVIRANYFRRILNVWLESGGEREITLEEWFTLVSATRPPSQVKPEPQAKAKVVEAPVAQSNQAPEASSGQTVRATPEFRPGAGPTEPSVGKDEKQAGGARQAQTTEGKDREKTKREGRSGSRKSKRRSRSSRNKPRNRGRVSGSSQGQSAGKPGNAPPNKPAQRQK